VLEGMKDTGISTLALFQGYWCPTFAEHKNWLKLQMKESIHPSLH